jgi:hypothetical protein
VAKGGEVIAVAEEEEDMTQALLAAAVLHPAAMTTLLVVKQAAGVQEATFRSERIRILLCLLLSLPPSFSRAKGLLRLFAIFIFTNPRSEIQVRFSSPIRHLHKQRNFIGQIPFCSYFLFWNGKHVPKLNTSAYNTIIASPFFIQEAQLAEA